MRQLTTLASAILISVAFSAPAAAQHSEAVRTVAGILAEVTHFPGEAEKQTLQELASQPATTAHEKVLIEAIVGMEHQVSEVDKAKLDGVAADTDAPEAVRTLAEILGRFLHMASDADKATLNALAM